MSDTLQFPLPLLAYGTNQFDRLDIAISYAFISTGLHEMKKPSSTEVEHQLADADVPCASGLSQEQVHALVLGAEYCGIKINSARYSFKNYKTAESFLDRWKSKGLTIPWTRVPKNMVFEARDGSEKTYLRFTALCAANAIIGSKPFAIVTRPRVRAGMLGYSSGSLLFDKAGNLHDQGRALIAERDDPQPTIPTRDQIPTLLTNLVKSALLNRFTPGRGALTYYSKKLSAEEIATALLNLAERNATNPKLVELGERIRRAKQGALLCGGEKEVSPHNTSSAHNREVPTSSPPVPHQVPTSSPHNAALNAALNATENAARNAGVASPQKTERQETVIKSEADIKSFFEQLRASVAAPARPGGLEA